MKGFASLSLIISIIFSFCFCDGIDVTDHTQLALVDRSRATFRNGTVYDLDDITTTMLDAFGAADDFRYMLPELEQHRNYTWYCCREKFRNGWSNPSWNGAVKVVAVSQDGTKEERVVSFGIWARVVTRKDSERHAASFWDPFYSLTLNGPSMSLDDKQPPYDCSDGLGGANATRVKYVESQLSQAQKDLVDPIGRYYELKLLATHPTWDGHGFAAMSVKWGLEMAKHLRVPAIVMSSREGFNLYQSLGFETLKNISIPKLEGPGHLLYHLMKHESF